jgi:ribosome-associated protein
VLVDLGDIVVHVMHPSVRSYYNLEEIWGGKEVQLKKAASPRRRSRSDRAAPARRVRRE